MELASARVARFWAAIGICVSIAAVAFRAQAGNPRETGAKPQALEIPSGAREGRSTFTFRPKDVSSPRPAVVYLNGLCGVTTNGCGHFKEGVEPFGWLVCPPANVACPGGGASWGGSTRDRRDVIDGAVEDVSRAFPGEVDASAPTLLVGFSQGAYTAVSIVRETPAKYTGLLLIGADVTPSVAELKKAGVTRVVLSAGANDMAAAPMSAHAKSLAKAGFQARFVSLGAVGHTYVADADHAGAITEALSWLTEKRDEARGS